jgi:hypothetical protein
MPRIEMKFTFENFVDPLGPLRVSAAPLETQLPANSRRYDYSAMMHVTFFLMCSRAPKGLATRKAAMDVDMRRPKQNADSFARPKAW